MEKCGFLFVVSTFLGIAGWKEGLPDLQDPADGSQRPKTVRLFQQDWQADCKQDLICLNTYTFFET